MNDYKPVITEEKDGTFHTIIVCVEDDGFNRVIHGYKGRHFKSRKSAIKSTTNYIKKHDL